MPYDGKDDFWDLEKLLPKKRPAPGMRPFATKPAVTEQTVSAREEADIRGISDEARRLTVLPHRGEAAVSAEEYGPADNRFIRQVRILRTQDRFDFYDVFRKAALTYFDKPAAPCRFVPFFSYMPQYDQLNADQRNYYFYWRDCVRRGRYPETDHSYILLYAYEILNLPDLVPPEHGLCALCDLWAAYRERFPRIDHYFAATVQDYCLLYRLPCPSGKIDGFLQSVLAEAPLKEFYLSGFSEEGEAGAYALTAYLSDYDWRNSRYAGGDSGDLYRTHMTAALTALFGLVSRENFGIGPKTDTVVYRRSAFQSSVCTMKVKCRMEIEYYPLSQALALRRAITAAVRYAENRIRALIGVKSRLGVKDLPDGYRTAIDRYFEAEEKKQNAARRRAAMPEYEWRYDAPEEDLSILSAEEIERSSWQTTERLVESIEAEAEPSVPPLPAEPDPAPSGNESADADGGFSAFLAACADGDAEEQKKIASSAGLPADLFAERINTFFADEAVLGDVVLEADGDGIYHLIEDYREDIAEWLKSI